MPNTTPNLGLIKPLVTEKYDIAKVTNENADKIDLLLAPKANPTFTGVVTASQIKFPATQVPSADPNTLDDYEEGTWTPIPVPATGTITSYTSNGYYTKIGNVVAVTFECALTDIGTGAGALIITGLPFSSKLNFSGVIGIEPVGTGDHIAGYILGTEIHAITQISNGASILLANRGVVMVFTYLTF